MLLKCVQEITISATLMLESLNMAFLMYLSSFSERKIFSCL